MSSYIENLYTELKAEHEQTRAKNQRLAQALEQARTQLLEMQQQLQALNRAPATTAIVINPHTQVGECEVFYNGKRMFLALHPNLDPQLLKPGKLVRVSEQLVITKLLTTALSGTIVNVSEILSDQRVVVRTSGADTQVLSLVPGLEDIQVGESLLANLSLGLAWEKIDRGEVEQSLSVQIPQVSYAQIGGLDLQIEQIRDALELPFRYPELYQHFGLSAPKGILLYGPPGCGKTMIAKAVATSLGEEGSYFLSIKGPELLSKFVGETERQIRAIFSRARELATSTRPVVIFFDEMEALFRTRGSGISSDVETLIVPQLLAEIDGVETLKNVIVIGATNREDMLDPAVLRSGRLDVRIRIDRPNLAQAMQILQIYLPDSLPLAPDSVLSPQQFRQQLLVNLRNYFAQRNQETALYRLSYNNGESEIIYAEQMLSGAVLAAVVDRAKKNAIKRVLLTRSDHENQTDKSQDSEKGIAAGVGLNWEDLHMAAREEVRQLSLLANTLDPAEWAHNLGISGRGIVKVESLGESR